MNLTLIEAAGISQLRGLPEFQLLIKALEEELKALEDRIYDAADDASERRAVADWRALRTCINRLRGLPEAAREDAEALRDRMGFIPGVPRNKDEEDIIRRFIYQDTPDDQESPNGPDGPRG